MESSEITKQRLINQQIAGTNFTKPEEMVKWFGAVQSQDYTAAKWALGLRLPDSKDEDIEQAFNAGKILRTHILRPTWHFIIPEDIRWMLALTAPRVKQTMNSANRKLSLDNAVFTKSNDVIAKALEGGKHLTRAELALLLQRNGIDTNDLRLTHLVLQAELDAIICSGPRDGKQFTYALIDERVPPVKPKTREESLAELTKRYFISHGPATIHDYAWWSGLTVADAKIGLESVKSAFLHENIDNKDYYFAPTFSVNDEFTQKAYLLPNYDEYTVAYKDRTAIFEAEHGDKMHGGGNPLFNNVIVINGQAVGTWKGNIGKIASSVTTKPFNPLNEFQQKAFCLVRERYFEFFGKKHL